MAPTLDPEVVTEMKSILAEHEGVLAKKFVTQDEAAASVKAVEGKITDLLTAQETKLDAKLDAKLKEERTASERRIKELSARAPGIVSGAAALEEYRSLGSRFVETAEYKTWAAGDQRSRTRLQLTVKGRIRQPLEVRVAGTITEPSSGFPIVPTRVGYFAPPVLPMVMRDLLTVVNLSSGNAIEYVLTTWNYAADYQIAEGDKKAQGDVTYQDKSAMVRTIAWYIKVSRQMLADAPYFAATIDSQLLYGVAKKEDHEILHGDGAAGHLLGILPQATALPADVLAGILYSPDQILAAIAYLGSLGHITTAIVLNPVDWAAMQITKTAQGIYVLGGPPSANAAATLWGRPVVTTAEMTAGTFLVGEFPPNATLFDRESPSVDVAYENEDDFVRNLVTMRCEERIALAVYRPQAFVKGAVVPTVTTGGAQARREPGK